jgi:hypothetical protein
VEDREVEGHEVEEIEVKERKVEPPLLPKAGSEATGRLPDISVPCAISCLLLAVRGEGGATGPLTSCRNRSTKRLASSRTFSGSTCLSASSHDGIIGGGVPTATGTATTGLMAGSAVGGRRRVGAGGACGRGDPGASSLLRPSLRPPASSALAALAAVVVIARR